MNGRSFGLAARTLVFLAALVLGSGRASAADASVVLEETEASIVAGSVFLDFYYTSNASNDGYTVFDTAGGESCRKTTAGNRYFYFDVDSDFAKSTDTEIVIKAYVYQNNTKSVRLQYNSTSATYTPSVQFRDGSAGWSWMTFTVSDAAFAETQNYDSDFRINSPTGGDLMISQVVVERPVVSVDLSTSVQSGGLSIGEDSVYSVSYDSLEGAWTTTADDGMFVVSVPSWIIESGQDKELYLDIEFKDLGTDDLEVYYSGGSSIIPKGGTGVWRTERVYIDAGSGAFQGSHTNASREISEANYDFSIVSKKSSTAIRSSEADACGNKSVIGYNVSDSSDTVCIRSIELRRAVVKGGSPQIYSDSSFSSDDIDTLLASFNVADFGAKGDDDGFAGTDDTEAFMDAVFSAVENGGGVVYVPDAAYRIEGRLEISRGVTLRGVWKSPDDIVSESLGVGGIGSLLHSYYGAGHSDWEAFIQLYWSGGIKDLAIYYPEQYLSDDGGVHSVVEYPFTIRQPKGDSANVVRVTVYNPYNCVLIGPFANELFVCREFYASPLNIGFERDAVFDVARYYNISFSNRHWIDSGFDLFDPLSSGLAQNDLKAYIKANATGAIMKHTAWIFAYNWEFEGFNIGVETRASESSTWKGPTGSYFGLSISDCNIGVQLGRNVSYGLSIAHSTIDVDEECVYATSDFDSLVKFDNVSFSSANSDCIYMANDGVVTAVNCDFIDWGTGYSAVNLNAGAASLGQCYFGNSGETDVSAASTANAVSLASNTYVDGTSSLSIDAAVSLKQNTANLNLPDSGDSVSGFEFNVVNYEDKMNSLWDSDGDGIDDTALGANLNAIFDVTASAYGATPDDASDDDLSAIQAALDAAGAANGGIVYMPAGEYLLAAGGSLIVPTGVELRGSFDGPHHTQKCKGSMIVVDGTSTSGDPLIKLSAASGARGFTIRYDDQVSPTSCMSVGGITAWIDFPYALQGRGEHVWVKDVTFLNAYRGIDFSSYQCDEHFVDYAAGMTVNDFLTLGGASDSGYVANIQAMNHYWSRSPYSNGVSGAWLAEQSEIWRSSFRIRDVTKQKMMMVFSYADYAGILLDDDVNPDGSGLTDCSFLLCGIDGASRALEIGNVDTVDLMGTQLVVVNKDSDNHREVIAIGPDASNSVIRLFNTNTWGKPIKGVDISSGSVVLQQISFDREGEVGVYASGGDVVVDHSYFNSAYGSTQYGGSSIDWTDWGLNVQATVNVDSYDYIGNVNVTTEVSVNKHDISSATSRSVIANVDND